MGQPSLNIQQDVSLQSRSGMATPAVAKYLIEVESLKQINAALDFAGQEKLPFLVLGDGSNTVFTGDYAGLIIVNKLRGIEVSHPEQGFVQLSVAAGENWHELVETCLEKNWYGFENLALIPGSVGAAPMQNIGAYGVEVGAFIESVTYLDSQSRQLQTVSQRECKFSYRDSIFKQELSGRAIIIKVDFKLNETPNVNTSYVALKHKLPLSPNPKDVFTVVCEMRAAKLPLPKDIPNCGSFFKNPVVSAEQRASLLATHPNLVSFPLDGQYKLAAAWLIEQLGWKQRNLEGVRVHESQALVITNPKKARGSAVAHYAQQIQQDVLHEYGVQLEIEPRLL